MFEAKGKVKIIIANLHCQKYWTRWRSRMRIRGILTLASHQSDIRKCTGEIKKCIITRFWLQTCVLSSSEIIMSSITRHLNESSMQYYEFYTLPSKIKTYLHFVLYTTLFLYNFSENPLLRSVITWFILIRCNLSSSRYRVQGSNSRLHLKKASILHSLILP